MHLRRHPVRPCAILVEAENLRCSFSPEETIRSNMPVTRLSASRDVLMSHTRYYLGDSRSGQICRQPAKELLFFHDSLTNNIQPQGAKVRFQFSSHSHVITSVFTPPISYGTLCHPMPPRPHSMHASPCPRQLPISVGDQDMCLRYYQPHPNDPTHSHVVSCQERLQARLYHVTMLTQITEQV